MVRADIEYLRTINLSELPLGIRIVKGSLLHCLSDLASRNGLDENILKAESEVDCYGGFDEGYPKGSITRSEGRLLFALIRTLGLSRVLEIGTLHGCSTNHLAAAVGPPVGGSVVSIDNKSDFSKVGSWIVDKVRDQVKLVEGDLFDVLPSLEKGSFDLIFEDSAHLEETTKFCIEEGRRLLAPGGWLMVHDTLCTTHVKGVRCRDRVLKGIALAGMRKKFVHYVIDDSTYGMGICRTSC